MFPINFLDMPLVFAKIRRLSVNSQAGVTLLLALLVLSAILAISFSLATILLTEVRSSGDLIRTEPAFYAAEGITEEALYKIKRQVPPGSFAYTTKLGAVVLNSPPPVESATTSPIFQDSVAKGYTFETTPKHYALYDPTNPTGPGYYGRITLTYLDTGNTDVLEVYLCEFDPLEDPNNYSPPGPACSNPADNTYWKVRDFDLRPITSPQTWDLDPSKQQELIVFNSGSTGNVFIQVQTYGPGPTYTPKGIPYSGQTSVDISAKNAGLTRKMKVIIPNN